MTKFKENDVVYVPSENIMGVVVGIGFIKQYIACVDVREMWHNFYFFDEIIKIGVL